MKRFLRQNGLTLFLVTLFALILVGQSLTGQREFNADQEAHQQPTLTYPSYVTSGHFVEATFEKWESECVQMFAFVLLTVWLRQKGSPESKPLEGEQPEDEDPEQHRGRPDAPWPVRRGGWVLKLYSHSLSLAFLVLFLTSFALHAAGGAAEYGGEQEEHGQARPSVLAYVTTSRFWFESLQNWQSEFLAVGSIVYLSVYLRERGSPESKPVAHPHSETGSE